MFPRHTLHLHILDLGLAKSAEPYDPFHTPFPKLSVAAQSDPDPAPSLVTPTLNFAGYTTGKTFVCKIANKISKYQNFFHYLPPNVYLINSGINTAAINIPAIVQSVPTKRGNLQRSRCPPCQSKLVLVNHSFSFFLLKKTPALSDGCFCPCWTGITCPRHDWTACKRSRQPIQTRDPQQQPQGQPLRRR